MQRIPGRPGAADLSDPAQLDDLARHAGTVDRFETLGATTLLSRAAQPDEIAEVIAFLASPEGQLHYRCGHRR